ncbi:glyoxalase [Mycobacterium sp. AMU20-3851]|uniref:VOC family protein n=1 Tax=Mycobacterium sp. AMU20-3851 TaxID=3122055 RepID=UPI003754ABD6
MVLALAELQIADPADAWADAGFSVADGAVRVGGVTLRLVGRERGTGIVGWSLSGLPTDHPIDGIPTTPAQAPVPGPERHANGVTSIDHVVLFSPDLGRTVAALAEVGAHPRRERDGELGGRVIRQIFFRLGEVILEVVGDPDATHDGPSALWGVTFTVTDIDATAAFFGGRTSPVKDAVQPGRRITTLDNRALGMSVRTAMIS